MIDNYEYDKVNNIHLLENKELNNLYNALKKEITNSYIKLGVVFPFGIGSIVTVFDYLLGQNFDYKTVVSIIVIPII